MNDNQFQDKGEHSIKIMADDRVILLTNRGDGVDEVLNDEYTEEDEIDRPGINLIRVIAHFKIILAE